MSNDSGISKVTIRKYLEYLESAFLIKVLHKVDINAKRFKRITNFKVYLTNPSLRTALFSPVSETDKEMGNLVETAILSQWMHRENLDLTYARWKVGSTEGEVDMVLVDRYFKPVWAAEIKWSDKFFRNPKELKSLIKFCESNQFDKAVITTIEQFGTKEINDLNFTFIPSCVYAYNVGVNTIRQKSLASAL